MGWDEIIEKCRQVLDDPLHEAIRKWKEEGDNRKAIGAFPVYSPVEIVWGAGMLPVGVFGGGNRLEIVHADSRFQSFICSIIKSTLELGLTDELKLLDGVLFHSICDSARNLASLFQRNFPHLFVEYLHLPQNMNSQGTASYLHSEFQRVKSNLESFFGISVSQEELKESLKVYNQKRALTRQLYQIRRKAPHLVSAVETYLLLRAGTLLPPEEHNHLLAEAVEVLPARKAKPQDRVKVILEGTFCEQMPLELLELLEEAGCYILDDDLLIGWRWFTEDVPEGGDPLRSLAESYLERSHYSSVRHDWRKPRFESLVDKVRACGAEAVIFCLAKFCEPALFDYVLFKEALEKEGIPHLVLEFEEKMWTFERLRTEVETFVESILFE